MVDREALEIQALEKAADAIFDTPGMSCLWGEAHAAAVAAIDAYRSVFSEGMTARDSLPAGHTVLEQAEMPDGRVSQHVRSASGDEYQRIVHSEEAYPDENAITAYLSSLPAAQEAGEVERITAAAEKMAARTGLTFFLDPKKVKAFEASMSTTQPQSAGEAKAEPVAVADALERCRWDDTPIGTKAIIQAAIVALRAAAPHPPADALRGAVEAEREACAQIADEMQNGVGSPAPTMIATKIRSRAAEKGGA